MIQKKVSFLSIVLILFLGCASSNLKVKPDYLKSNIKSVLVISVYIDKQAVPSYPKGLESFDYSKEERKKIYSALLDGKAQINKSVKDLLSRGKYKFNVITYKDNDYSFLKKREADSPIRGYKNISFYISKNDIAKLSKKYKADAIFFHYIQAFKEMENYRLKGGGSVNLPLSYLFYYPYLYDKNGALLLGSKNGKFYSLLEIYKQIGVTRYTVGKLEMDSLMKKLKTASSKEKFDKQIGLTDPDGVLAELY